MLWLHHNRSLLLMRKESRVGGMSHESQGTAFDPSAAGHERQGRVRRTEFEEPLRELLGREFEVVRLETFSYPGQPWVITLALGFRSNGKSFWYETGFAEEFLNDLANAGVQSYILAGVRRVVNP